MIDGKRTLAFGQKSIPEVSDARDRSIRGVDLVFVVEVKANIARSIGDKLVSINAIDSPAVLQLWKVRTSWTHSCWQRWRKKISARKQIEKPCFV